MQLLLFSMIFPALLAAQQGVVSVGPGVLSPQPSPSPSVPVQSTRPADLCAIEGQVLNAATGEPVKKANLVLRRTDVNPAAGGLPIGYTTASDAAGQFAMKDIEPGKYTFFVNRTGFVSMNYGARGPMRPGTTLSLEAGQKLTNVVFRLTPHAVITGKVVDEDGEPMAMVQIQPMKYQYMNGKRQLMPVSGGQTNDLGEYRIFGLAPGRYYLNATYRSEMMFEPQMDRSARPAPEEGYVPTYYPGTTDPSAAGVIDVPAGGQLRGLDFTLSKTRTVRIRGHVQNVSGPSRSRTSVMLMPRDRGGYFSMMGNRAVGPKGDFEIRDVPPGAYVLIAQIFESGRPVAAKFPVDVGSNNIDDLLITIPQPVDVSGRVEVEGGQQPRLSDVRVMLRPRDQGPMFFGPGSDGRVKDDGTFTLSNVSPDAYDVAVTGLPDGYYVKSVRLGNEEVLETGLDLTRAAGAAVTVRLSPGAGQVEGSVMNAQQQPAPGVTVVLIPNDAKRRERMQNYKNVTTDQYGRFTLKNIDPGEYKVFAWEDIEYGAYMDPDFVKPVESRGEPVTIRENSRERVQLSMIPAEGAGQQGRAGN